MARATTANREPLQKPQSDIRPLSHPEELLQYPIEHKLAIAEELKSCNTRKADNTVARVVVYKSLETVEEEAVWNAEGHDAVD
ncbi:hypothetical protein FPRO04_13210 [Fusarium proliferatum]|nr:hypothetical protein FPRO04_13210 [Fusarium proliferatum]